MNEMRKTARPGGVCETWSNSEREPNKENVGNRVRSQDPEENPRKGEGDPKREGNGKIFRELSRPVEQRTKLAPSATGWEGGAIV